MPTKTMTFKEVSGVLLAVHPVAAPDDADWAAYVAFCKKLPPTCRRTLAISKGGGPNAKQRKQLNEEYLKDVKMTVAVVNDSAMVRHIVTALGWFNSLIKSFPYTAAGIQDALKYLNVTGGEADRIVAEIKKMELELATSR